MSTEKQVEDNIGSPNIVLNAMTINDLVNIDVGDYSCAFCGNGTDKTKASGLTRKNGIFTLICNRTECVNKVWSKAMELKD